MDPTLLWIPATLIASAGQVARNVMQRRLVETIGTVGATQVRFLYGFPFALLFLAVILLATGEALPRPGPLFWPFLALGALTQIAATALMLAAMRERSFSVVTALLKTEPIQLAVFGLVVLGDSLTATAFVAIGLATIGVVLVSAQADPTGETNRAGGRAVALGLAAGALFALSAVGYRGEILALESGSFLVRASVALASALALQSAMLIAWLGLFDRPALTGSLREWRPSLGAGFVGAASSQFWFIGFALTAAANVRTLALVEIVLAQLVSRRLFTQRASSRDIFGMAFIVAGVALLLATVR